MDKIHKKKKNRNFTESKIRLKISMKIFTSDKLFMKLMP